MRGPDNTDLPFFAYGVFRQRELGFLSIVDLVEAITDPFFVNGTLYIRDGLPIVNPSLGGRVTGGLITFRKADRTEAYERINGLEPDKQYRWETVAIDEIECNYLVGRSPTTGSVPADEGWNGRNDPLFTSALEVVEETLKSSSQFNRDLKPMFRLQMAYLLLWSSIERYASLRYHLGNRAVEKVMQIADEPKFAELLRRHVTRTHKIQRADKPVDHYKLDSQSPKTSLTYYYQIRSNITHRGKGVHRDHEIVRDSLVELFDIFRELLANAFESAAKPSRIESTGLVPK